LAPAVVAAPSPGRSAEEPALQQTPPFRRVLKSGEGRAPAPRASPTCCARPPAATPATRASAGTRDPGPPAVLYPCSAPWTNRSSVPTPQQRIEGTIPRLRQIDPAKLPSGEQDSLQTVQSFLEKAVKRFRRRTSKRAFTLPTRPICWPTS